MIIAKDSSAVLDYLKCLLCIGVVFIHSNFFPNVKDVMEKLGYIYTEDYNTYQIIKNYFSSAFLDQTCVPLFFCISGYLFFLNIPKKYNLTTYVTKIKSRIGSLLVPYLIANGIMIMTVSSISFAHDQQFSIVKFFQAFWSYNGGFPIDVPTWYIRDLLVLSVLTPLIYNIIKRTSILLPIVLLFCWFANVWITSIPGFSVRSSLFFSIGAYFSIKGVDVVGSLKVKSLWYIYLVIFSIIYATHILFKHDFLLKLSVLSSFPMWITFAHGVYKLTNKPCPRVLLTGTFFVFLYHFSLAHRIPVYLIKVFGCSELSVTLCYFLGAVITICSLLAIYYVMRISTPKITSLIVGGR